MLGRFWQEVCVCFGAILLENENIIIYNDAKLKGKKFQTACYQSVPIG